MDSDEEDEKGGKERGKKSGSIRTLDDKMKVEIDWPYLHVRSGHNKNGMAYDSFTVDGFVKGFLLTILASKGERLRSQLYLEKLIYIQVYSLLFHKQSQIFHL